MKPMTLDFDRFCCGVLNCHITIDLFQTTCVMQPARNCPIPLLPHHPIEWATVERNVKYLDQCLGNAGIGLSHAHAAKWRNWWAAYGHKDGRSDVQTVGRMNGTHKEVLKHGQRQHKIKHLMPLTVAKYVRLSNGIQSNAGHDFDSS